MSLRLTALAAFAVFAVAQTVQTPAPTPAPAAVKPNFELPAQWSAAKVSKLVFDTSVTPHWFSTGDRFWYSYKTSTGTAYYIVDPVKATKVAMFDHAKLAEQLTLILGLPYDGEHLPILGMRLINHDTAVQFHVSIPRTAVVPGLGPEPASELRAARVAEQNSTDQTQTENGGGGRAGRGNAQPPRGNRNVYFDLDLATQKATMLGSYQPPPRKPSWAQISPDGKTIVFSRNHNLYMMDAANYAKALVNVNDPSIVETQLSTDGAEFDSYGRDDYTNQNEDLGKFNNNGRSGRGSAAAAGRGGVEDPSLDQKDTSPNPRKPAVRLIWSRDSSEFVLTKADERKVLDLWVIHTLHEPRPTLETYKYAMPGDVNVPLYSLWAFNVNTHKGLELKADAFADQHFQVQTDPVTNKERAAMPEGQQPPAIWLGGASDKIYFLRISRDLHKVDLCTANPADGSVKPIVQERSNIYIMTTHPVRLLDHGQEFLLWSERDGWGHYYLYNSDGTLKNQVDRGEFVAGDIEAVDDATNTLYFTALGVKAGENVYYAHLFRIALDGTGMRMLDGPPTYANGGNATHAINASDDGKYFVDNYSRVDSAPESGLFGPEGHLLHLETTDTKALLAAGFQYPTPFTVKADDGITDLYGVMFKPFDFDPHKKYPLIEYVYPGPQTESVETTFNPKSAQMQLAQFGFVVIEVGNRGGSPERDSWYHTYGYHNLRDYGLADKKRAAEELAQMYPFIDINRVGITGHSGGGFMSTAALLEYPDFFKVAVSESGNHDNNVYNNTWSEEHDGIQEIDGPDGKVTFQFSIDKNSDLAKNLKGHLLLSTGDMDNNVHMSNTMRLANALIRANKRFDIVILPGERHGYASDTEWFFWRKAEYFTQYLLGSAPHGADMMALQREQAETGKSGGGN